MGFKVKMNDFKFNEHLKKIHRVTIGGVSAGSASVTHLMASPLTEGI